MSQVPDLYQGRVPAYVKHALLKSYLEKLVLIIGMAGKSAGRAEICYVDCFAGPWGSDDEKLEGTSIALSLQTLARCKTKLASLGVQAQMRAIYVEKDRRAFKRLEAYLQQHAPKAVEARTLQGDFVELRGAILEAVGKTAFTFFFIDPKGWTPIMIDVLQPLLERPRSEFLINFIYEFINRTASIAAYEEDMRRLLGRQVALGGKTPEEREESLVDAYRGGLKASMPRSTGPFAPRTAYVTVLHPESRRPKYHLVYVSTHPKGVVEFMTVSQDVDLIQARVHFARRLDEQGVGRGATQDMFVDDALAAVTEARGEPQDIDKFWRGHLAAGTRRIDLAAFADILEQTNWLPNELQSSLKRLIDAGEVENLDGDSKRRPKNPLHFAGSGERLKLVRAASGTPK